EHHRAAAHALAAAGADLERVAGQLLPIAGTLTADRDGWAFDWLAGAAPHLAEQAPGSAVGLLRRCLARLPADDPRHAALKEHLAHAALLLRGPASTATLRGLLDETTAPEARVQLTAALAHGLYVQGRWADALAALDRAERTGAADAAWAPLFQGLRATIHHGAGHSERCAVLARQVIADARSGRHPFGEAYGRHALSCALLRDRRTEAALAENTLALRAAARCRGLVDADPGPLAEAVAYYRGVARPLDLGQALEDGAAVRAALGEPAAARELLQQALERYARLGAAWDARRAVGRLRALGVRTGPRAARNGRPSTGWAALTPAELRVAHRVAQGRSNPEIAAELFLSPRTVQTHVSSILTKLGARSRTEVARQAAERSSQHP
uniref:helix-turn-helix domain-containing protein n=1 Tax=Streptomyces clavuligerus TaxID=1901 RepID=UPI0018D190ED